MQPALSVILLTVLSGAGCGLSLWLGGALLFASQTPSGNMVLTSSVVMFVLLSTAGLCSTFHLGHPERAWRAFTQWRTSWLSREGFALLAAIGLAFIMGLAVYAAARPTLFVQILATLLAIVSIATTYITSMIYASLRAIPAWSNKLVIIVFQALAISSGGIVYNFLHTIFTDSANARELVLVMVFLSLLAKLSYWLYVQRMGYVATRLSAIAVTNADTARSFDPPHTGLNYLTREMAFVVADHMRRAMRTLTVLLAFVVPILLLSVEARAGSTNAAILAGFAAASCLVGLMAERWLFFAEAQHAMRLYYDREKV